MCSKLHSNTASRGKPHPALELNEICNKTTIVLTFGDSNLNFSNSNQIMFELFLNKKRDRGILENFKMIFKNLKYLTYLNTDSQNSINEVNEEISLQLTNKVS